MMAKRLTKESRKQVRKKDTSSISKKPWLRPPRPEKHPWLVYTHEDGQGSQIFHSISKDCKYTKKLNVLHRRMICTSSHGWLLISSMYQTENDCLLFNPVSMETVKLPPLKLDGFMLSVLTSSPLDPNCAIILIDKNNCAAICRPSDNEWIIQVIAEEELGIHSVVSFRGEIYLLFQNKKSLHDDFALGCFHVEHNLKLTLKGKMEMGPLPRSLSEDNLFRRFMVDCCGEILMVTINFLGGEEKVVHSVEVTKMDFTTNQWKIIERLGDHALFLNHGYALWCSAGKAGIKGNCIYFTETITMPNTTSLCVYDLEDKSISILLPCPELDPNCYTSYWVLMDENTAGRKAKKFPGFQLKKRLTLA